MAPGKLKTDNKYSKSSNLLGRELNAPHNENGLLKCAAILKSTLASKLLLTLAKHTNIIVPLPPHSMQCVFMYFPSGF